MQESNLAPSIEGLNRKVVAMGLDFYAEVKYGFKRGDLLTIKKETIEEFLEESEMHFDDGSFVNLEVDANNFEGFKEEIEFASLGVVLKSSENRFYNANAGPFEIPTLESSEAKAWIDTLGETIKVQPIKFIHPYISY